MAPDGPRVRAREVGGSPERVAPAAERERVERALARGRVRGKWLARFASWGHGASSVPGTGGRDASTGTRGRAHQTRERPAAKGVKLPAVARLPGGRDPRRYEDLARRAREAGYTRVSGPAVHGWVKQGLLPLVVVTPTGFGSRAITEPPGIARQLKALCHHRYDPPATRSLTRLGLYLWLDGFPIAERAVRDGLTYAIDLPGRARSATRIRDADEWDIVNQHVFEGGFGAALASPRDLAAGLGDFLAAQAGTTSAEKMDPAGLTALERLSGADRLLQAIRGVGERPVDLRVTMPLLVVARLRAAIEAASVTDLDSAREHALTLRAAFSEAAKQAAERGNPGYAGLDQLVPGLDTPLGLGQLVVALLADPHAAASLVAGLQPSAQ